MKKTGTKGKEAHFLLKSFKGGGKLHIKYILSVIFQVNLYI